MTKHGTKANSDALLDAILLHLEQPGVWVAGAWGALAADDEDGFDDDGDPTDVGWHYPQAQRHCLMGMARALGWLFLLNEFPEEVADKHTDMVLDDDIYALTTQRLTAALAQRYLVEHHVVYDGQWICCDTHTDWDRPAEWSFDPHDDKHLVDWNDNNAADQDDIRALVYSARHDEAVQQLAGL